MSFQQITAQTVLDIMRKVIGQRDASAPDATDEILLQYVNQFIQLNLPQDVKLFDKWTWYEFDTTADDFEYDFNPDGDGDVFVNLRPPAYSNDSSGTAKNSILMYWFQSPELFYEKWGYITTLADLDKGQPTDILFWNNQLVVRPVPDDVYTITIKGYKKDEDLAVGDNLSQDYMYRYIAYGTARDYLRDFLDIDTLAQIEPAYQEYKMLVLNRTASQNVTQIKVPRF